jgi:small subunit ribosomal protein S13
MINSNKVNFINLNLYNEKSGPMGMRKSKEAEQKEDEKTEKLKDKKAMMKKKKAIEGIRGIVRIGEIDVEGDKKIRIALLRIKGIGKSLSKALVVASGLNPEALIGSLTEEEMKKLEEVMKNPGNYGIPFHMLNRRLDPQTGENRHLISSELNLAIKSDIDAMKKMRCYKGIRHELGLPCRGQRTRSSFRTGGIVGVVKKKQAPGAAPAGGAGKPSGKSAEKLAEKAAEKPAAKAEEKKQ